MMDCMPHVLIVTQKVDERDAALGFMHGWISEFAKQCGRVTVICLEKGSCHFSDTVRVLSLGKEGGHSRIKYLWRFSVFLWKERAHYDAVFVHMNPEYVVLGGLFWKLMGKRVGLWYTHQSVSVSLRIAEKLVAVIFTASDKSFRLQSKKVRVIGHGIDTELFCPAGIFPREKVLLHVGRISPTKDQMGVVRVFSKVLEKVPDALLYIAGKPIFKKDERYLTQVEEYVKKSGLEEKIRFLGAVRNREMPAVYRQARVVVNMSKTGSLDKDVLEAMAVGVPAVTTNTAFEGVVPAECMVKNESALIQKIADFLMGPHSGTYRNTILQHHRMKDMVQKIVSELDTRPRTTDITGIYGTIVNKKARGDYETYRWFHDRLSKADFEMTRRSIFFHVLGRCVRFGKYLELGQGAGTWTQYFIVYAPHAHFDTVDISKDMIVLAKKKLAAFTRVQYYACDFCDFSPDTRYDFFFSCRAIEYIPDKEAVVAKIARLLKPGGSGMIITKTPKHFRNLLLLRKVSALHQGQIAPATLRRMLEHNGLRTDAYPVTIHIPFLRSPMLNKALCALCSRYRMNVISQFFAESYCVVFSKS